MNWSMVLDGILFWALVLDPRPKPPARIFFGARAALSFAVMFPQDPAGRGDHLLAARLLSLLRSVGRLFPSIGALTDQHIGGIVSWIPPSMMSVVGVLVVLNAMRLHEEAATEAEDDASSALAARSRSWTGR